MNRSCLVFFGILKIVQIQRKQFAQLYAYKDKGFLRIILCCKNRVRFFMFVYIVAICTKLNHITAGGTITLPQRTSALHSTAWNTVNSNSTNRFTTFSCIHNGIVLDLPRCTSKSSTPITNGDLPSWNLSESGTMRYTTISWC